MVSKVSVLYLRLSRQCLTCITKQGFMFQFSIWDCSNWRIFRNQKIVCSVSVLYLRLHKFIGGDGGWEREQCFSSLFEIGYRSNMVWGESSYINFSFWDQLYNTTCRPITLYLPITLFECIFINPHQLFHSTIFIILFVRVIQQYKNQI